MSVRPKRSALVALPLISLSAVLLAGCAPDRVQAEQSSGSTAPSSPPSVSATPTRFAIPARAPGEFGRVSLRTTTSRTVGSTAMVAGQVYRLESGCLDGADGRVVVDLHNAARGADRAKSVTTFSIACDGEQHAVDFQVATPTRPALYLKGTARGTVAYAAVVGTGRKATCGCN